MIKNLLRAVLGISLVIPVNLLAQRAELRPASPIILPGVSDSNSPAHWMNGSMSIYQSIELPLISTTDSSGTFRARSVVLNTHEHYPLWIESTWVDDTGAIYAWYHTEVGACGTLVAPKIGALISNDGGRSFTDLGVIMESGYWPDCNAQNGYFAGGNGDFTVLLDSAQEYFYFYFTNYSGPLYSQGVAVARMAFADRGNPAGHVWKFFQGTWQEPGRFGRSTAILPARESWTSAYTDSFWGPSLHWNIFLNQYVMLLSRSCCESGFPSEGIYISFNPDLGDPTGWTPPEKILGADQAGWYPQVIGIEQDGTDKVAGEVARFFMKGESYWELVFSK
jgi:hypothetical protein